MNGLWHRYYRPRLDKRCDRRTAGGQGGFTFAETLAAMLFVAIVIPVAIHGLVVANRAGVVADRTRVASQLAESLLTEFSITDGWRDADNAGDFGQDWPGYRWVFGDEAWGEDTMRLISIAVVFTVQDREYSVRLSTLVDDTEE